MERDCDASDTERQQTLDRIVAGGQLSAVEIIDSNGRVIAQSRGQLSARDSKELESLLEKAHSLKGSDDSLADGKDLDAVVVPLTDVQTSGQQLIVVPLRRASIENWLNGSEEFACWGFRRLG